MIKSCPMNRKPTFSRSITEPEWSLTILGLAIIFGAVVRLLPPILAGAPINDGGMFAVMMRDLRANQWALPVFTSYNHAEIPFVYPPFGFYIGALFESLGMSEAMVLLWLPALFTVATLPLFYLLALEMLGDRPRAAVATAFFALLPGSYVWFLMGGGLTRALGADFFILSLIFVRRALRNPDWKLIIPAVVFCSLTVMTHPQYALLTFVGCAVFGLFIVRTRKDVLSAVLIAGGTVLLSAPWWSTVIANHGINVFLLGGQSGDMRASLSALLRLPFQRQTIIPFVTMFWLLGIGWAAVKKRFDLFALFMPIYFLDQRSAPIMPSYILPLFAAYGILDALPALVSFTRERLWRTEADETLFNRPAFSMSLLAIVFYLFLESAFHADVILKLVMPPAGRTMMDWVAENSPEDAAFLILTGHPDAMTDAVQEWFPALADRHSDTTLQGLEWSLGGQFSQRWVELNTLQDCADVECVQSLAQGMELRYSYIILESSHISAAEFVRIGYKIVYEGGGYVVMK